MKKTADNIRKIGLLANADKKSCRTIVRQAARLIRQAGRTCLTEPMTQGLADLEATTFPSSMELARQADLLLVFGGDGTMLRVAREVVGCRTPIMGINAGGLGFLTAVQAHQLKSALQQVWAGKTGLESRPLIEAVGATRGTPIREIALNDFVIARGATPRLIELEVSVDGEVLTRYRCDGLIISSPTGSTAYSLAAGGAVISPSAQVLALTPICPHTLSNRSVIVDLNATVQVKVLSQRVDTLLTADGQVNIRLNAGDTLTIRRSRQGICLLHLQGTSFFQTLRRKLNWSGSTVNDLKVEP